MKLVQTPGTGSFQLAWVGDSVKISLETENAQRGRAIVRTDIGNASIRRREIIAATECGTPPAERAWHDVPMSETAPGRYCATLHLDEVGIFSAKACFIPESSGIPEWPQGENFRIKVAPAKTRRANSIYTAYVRQFGDALKANPSCSATREHEEALDSRGYTVIPPSGTFRDLAAKLDHIIERLGFRIIQLLPVFPVPTVFARMGRYGSSFAALDFLSVDPACAEFDRHATPLDQFRELADAVHARGASLFLDLPANHTGWAATLQTHHPEWYRRDPDGAFHSPGAWGVTWADLVELDYSNPKLRAYMAEVFLFWCRIGVDGFRCDAGYMIPEETWTYIVARVREEHPDTVFMLEGLGGDVAVTEALLRRSGLDWAYSETFQTYDRSAFERYLPHAISISESCGPLVHFAETHDNSRLAAAGKTWARLRTALSALLSQQGAWGMANGVEWFATEKIDVHGASSLNWGASDNMIGLIAKLNSLVACHPAFAERTHLDAIGKGDGNFLAVRRGYEGGAALALLNLDCGGGCTARWDGSAFPGGVMIDALSGEAVNIDPDRGVELPPGGFRFFEPAGSVALEADEPPLQAPSGLAVTEWNYPRDLKRIVPLPPGGTLVARARHPFRLRVSENGITLAALESKTGATGPFAVFKAPAYSGDGTASRRLALEIAVFGGGASAAERGNATIAIPPPPSRARVRVSLDSAALRKCRSAAAVLSNGAGAASLVRAAWGSIASKYDSLFAANPDPCVPSDRLVLWTRCRAWLQHAGYSREINFDSLVRFDADPSGRDAVWTFRVPCGTGRSASFAFRLALAEGVNAVRLEVKRLAGGENDAENAVRIVFRPDLEWRSFHSLTKAYAGAETAYPAAAQALSGKTPRGLRFAPAEGAFELEGENAIYHHEAQWTYNVPLPDDAERAQEGALDLFSPGWFSTDLAAGESCSLVGRLVDGNKNGPIAFPPDSGTASKPLLPVPDALERSLGLYTVRRDDLKTVIAGYPWFLDWGRDTLIFLRGLIAAGRTGESLDILTAFARFEERGTIPNIIHGKFSGNRDTSDAPLWLIVAAEDLVAALGAKRVLARPVARAGGRTIADAIESVLTHYLCGTPNGIRVDPASGLVWSPAHFTWMDTNYPAGTPRAGYPVEIQALWIRALDFAAREIDGKWAAHAAKARSSLVELFPLASGGLADCLRAPHGECARQAEKEDAIRPNELFAITLAALPENAVELRSGIIRSAAGLLVPGGNRSLADLDTQCDFAVRGPGGAPLNDAHHPYMGRYTGDEDTSRKVAYHNGTVWGWTFPMHAEAMVLAADLDPALGSAERRKVRAAAMALLSSAVDAFSAGAVAHLPENADGDAPHAQKGCIAQAWSESELLRVWRLLSK